MFYMCGTDLESRYGYATYNLKEILDTHDYAENCPIPHYLALLDAVTPWTAPDSLYGQVERMPEINDLPAYDIRVEKRTGADGTPGIALVSDDTNVRMINCYFTVWTTKAATLSVWAMCPPMKRPRRTDRRS
jgi:hypothetical protein